jgi:hypothetical protein
LIPVDRVAADRPFYSGKHRKHGMNPQVITSPGDILWVFGALARAVHDKKAEWIWGILDELEAAGLIDKGYQGAAHAKIPYREGTNRNPRKRPTAPTRNPRTRRTRKRPAQELAHPPHPPQAPLLPCCCPWRAGQLAKAIHALEIHAA